MPQDMHLACEAFSFDLHNFSAAHRAQNLRLAPSNVSTVSSHSSLRDVAGDPQASILILAPHHFQSSSFPRGPTATPQAPASREVGTVVDAQIPCSTEGLISPAAGNVGNWQTYAPSPPREFPWSSWEGVQSEPDHPVPSLRPASCRLPRGSVGAYVKSASHPCPPTAPSCGLLFCTGVDLRALLETSCVWIPPESLLLGPQPVRTNDTQVSISTESPLTRPRAIYSSAFCTSSIWTPIATSNSASQTELTLFSTSSDSSPFFGFSFSGVSPASAKPPQPQTWCISYLLLYTDNNNNLAA